MKLLILCVALVVGAPVASFADSISNYYGKWHIDSIAGYGEVSDGDAQANKLLGRTAEISATGFSLSNNTCNRNTTVFTTVEVDRFLLDEWRTDRRELDLGKSKLGKRAGYIDAGCGVALVLGRNRLLINQGGAILLASRPSE